MATKRGKVEGAALVNEMEGLEDKYQDPVYVNTAGPGQGAEATNFPAQFSQPDRAGVGRLQIKEGLVSRGGMTGTVSFGEKDAKVLQDRQKLGEALAFDQWLSTKFDPDDINGQMMLSKVAPEWYSRREQQIDLDAELQKRLAKIRLRGIQSQGDVKLVYAIETGKVKLPSHALWDPRPRANADYVPGLLSVRRWAPNIATGPYTGPGSMFNGTPNTATVNAPGLMSTMGNQNPASFSSYINLPGAQGPLGPAVPFPEVAAANFR